MPTTTRKRANDAEDKTTPAKKARSSKSANNTPKASNTPAKTTRATRSADNTPNAQGAKLSQRTKASKPDDTAKNLDTATEPPNSAQANSTNIQGGLKGDYRVTGTERSSKFQSFIIHDDSGKGIPCQRRGTNAHKLVFTHGAGGGLENPATEAFSRGYGSRASVVSFQGTMNLTSRVKAFEKVFEHVKDAVVVGGRSMGARAAVMTATAKGVKKVVLVSYPLQGPKGVRDEILIELANDVDVLFVVGSQDAMCDLGQLKTVRGKMKAESRVLVVKHADHGMGLLSGCGLSGKEKHVATVRLRLLTGEMAARWVEDKDSLKDGTEIGPEDVKTSEDANGTEKGEVPRKAKADDGTKLKSAKNRRLRTKRKTRSLQDTQSGAEDSKKPSIGEKDQQAEEQLAAAEPDTEKTSSGRQRKKSRKSVD